VARAGAHSSGAIATLAPAVSLISVVRADTSHHSYVLTSSVSPSSTSTSLHSSAVTRSPFIAAGSRSPRPPPLPMRRASGQSRFFLRWSRTLGPRQAQRDQFFAQSGGPQFPARLRQQVFQFGDPSESSPRTIRDAVSG